MEKEKKLRPPTDEELKELFRGIIQENHDHPPKPRRVKCNDCRHRIPGTVTCKLYPQIIPEQILVEQEKCTEFLWKYIHWYEILIEDEFINFFTDPNMQLYVSADKKVPHYLFDKFREIVHGMTTACSFGESGRAMFEKSADRNPIMVRAFNHYLETCPDGQNRFTNIWRTMEDHYEQDPETLSVEQIAVLILYPFWSRMGGSFEEEFAEDGRLGKYLLALQKKVKAMAEHPNSITTMSYLEAHKIFHNYIDVIANNENRENVPFYRKSAFKHSKEQITYAYKVFMAVAYRYGNNIYTQEEINGYNTVFALLWMPWVDDAFADEYIQCEKILNDTSLWGRFKNRTAIPYVKEKLDRLKEELFTKYKEVDPIEFMKEKDAFTNSILELVNKSVARAKEIPQDPQRKKMWLNRYVEDYCWNAYRIIGLTVRQEDVNCFWPMPTLYQYATHPETGNRFTEEQRKYISQNRTG